MKKKYLISIIFFLTILFSTNPVNSNDIENKNFNRLLKNLILCYKENNYILALSYSDSIKQFIEKKIENSKPEFESNKVELRFGEKKKYSYDEINKLILNLFVTMKINRTEIFDFGPFSPPDSFYVYIEPDSALNIEFYFKEAVRIEEKFFQWNLNRGLGLKGEIMDNLFSDFCKYFFENVPNCSTIKIISYWDIITIDLYGQDKHQIFKIYELGINDEVAQKINWHGVWQMIHIMNHENPYAYTTLFDYLDTLCYYKWYNPIIKEFYRKYNIYLK